MRDRVAWIAAAAYAALFTGLGCWRFAVHRNFVDFGIFAQTAASAFDCFCNGVEGSHWAYHFSPILYAAGGLVALWHSPYALIALQSVACALALPALYAIVRRTGGEKTARLALAAAFLYPPLAGLAFNDFHENDFAPAAVLWLFWACDRRDVASACIFAALALLVKEDQAVFVCAAGIACFVKMRGTALGTAGAAGAALAAAVALTFFAFIQPAAAAHAHWAPERFYAWDARDARDFWSSGIFGRIGFVALAFVPLLFLPFRSGAAWLAVLPLAEVIASRIPTTYTIGSHYAGAWIGWVLGAFALAIRTLPPTRAQRLLVACSALCALELLIADPLHPGLNLRKIEPRDTLLDAQLAGLPSTLAVSTQEEAYTHLALSNPNSTVLPEDGSARVRTPFALVDVDFPESPRLQEYGPSIRPPCFQKIHAAGAVELYRAFCSASSARIAPSAASGH